MRVRTRVAVLLLVGLVGTTLTGCAGSSADPGNPAGVRVHTTADPGDLRGAVLPEPYTKPRLTLVDTEGRRFDFAAASDTPVTLVFFGYTYCPDVCNTVLADVAMALRRMDPALRKRVSMVFVTTDPRRDTPRVIREYLDRFDRSFVGLTGSPASIQTAARRLGVYLTRPSALPGGGYEVGHGAQVIGFGPDGRARVLWTQGTTVADLRHDFTQLARTA